MSSLAPLKLQQPAGTILPLQKLGSMTEEEIRNLRNGPTTQLVTEKADGTLKGFGYDEYPLAAVRAGAPVADLAMYRFRPGAVPPQIVMPTDDPQAYAEIFHTILASIDAGEPLKVALIYNEPIMAYHRIGEGALNLGISPMVENLQARLNALINPNMHEKYMRIPPTDIKNVFASYPSGHHLRARVTGGVGRGLAC